MCCRIFIRVLYSVQQRPTKKKKNHSAMCCALARHIRTARDRRWGHTDSDKHQILLSRCPPTYPFRKLRSQHPAHVHRNPRPQNLNAGARTPRLPALLSERMRRPCSAELQLHASPLILPSNHTHISCATNFTLTQDLYQTSRNLRAKA